MSWLDEFFTAYTTVQSGGVTLPQASVLNFSTGLSASTANGVTTVTATAASFTAGGDLTGTSTSQQVVGLTGSASTVTIAAGTSLVATAGTGALTLGAMTGATTLPTGALSWAGASGKAGSIVSIAAAITLTAGAASSWKTSAGALTIDSAAALNLGTSTATSAQLGNAGTCGATTIKVAGVGAITCVVGTTTQMSLGLGGADTLVLGSTNAQNTLTPSGATFGPSVINPTISQSTQTSDLLARSIHLVPQAPFASAVTNVTGGNVYVDLATPISGSAESSLIVTRGGAFVAGIGADPGSAFTASVMWLTPGISPGGGNWSIGSNTSNATYVNGVSSVVYSIGGVSTASLSASSFQASSDLALSLGVLGSRWASGYIAQFATVAATGSASTQQGLDQTSMAYAATSTTAATAYQTFTLAAHKGVSIRSKLVARVKTAGTVLATVDQTLGAESIVRCYWTGSSNATVGTVSQIYADGSSGVVLAGAGGGTAWFVMTVTSSGGVLTVNWAKTTEVTTQAIVDVQVITEFDYI